jgi:soluble P-type ATPase
MIPLDIPGRGKLTMKNIVLDFNGTIALDGVLLPGVQNKLNAISEIMDVYIITADTFGTVLSSCSSINCKLAVLTEKLGSCEKLKFIESLGPQETAAIGNGNNDVLMLEKAVLGILVTGPEGSSTKALMAADVIVKDIISGLDLFLNPKRLVATLRE